MYCVISQGRSVPIIETRCDRDIRIFMQYCSALFLHSLARRIGVIKCALRAHPLSPTPTRLSVILLVKNARVVGRSRPAGYDVGNKGIVITNG